MESKFIIIVIRKCANRNIMMRVLIDFLLSDNDVCSGDSASP